MLFLKFVYMWKIIHQRHSKTMYRMVQSCLLLLVAEDGIKLRYGKADHIINIMRCVESVPPYKYVYHNIISNS
jgi:hypothetical protein